MAEFLLAAAGLIVATVAVGLVRILAGPADVDRTMAAQLLGTGGVATLLLVAAATEARGAEDAALCLALLAAFASIDASLCGVLRAFFGCFLSLLSGMKTVAPCSTVGTVLEVVVMVFAPMGLG